MSSSDKSTSSRGGGQKEKLVTKVARALLRDGVLKDKAVAERPFFNPEELTAHKREWTRRFVAGEGGQQPQWSEHLFEHFAIVGLPPSTNVRAVSADLRTFTRVGRGAGPSGLEVTPEGGAKEKPQYGVKGPSLLAEVMFSFPSDLPRDLGEQLAAFCFPHGVRPELLERTSSMSALNEVILSQPYQTHDDHSFVFLMKVADPNSVAPRTLYGVCCYARELVHRPPAVARAAFPDCTAPLARYMVAAPRCYCLLTHYPFFALHFRVLQTILGLERLDRMTAFAEELAAGFPPPPPSSRVTSEGSLADDEASVSGTGGSASGGRRAGGGGGGGGGSSYGPLASDAALGGDTVSTASGPPYRPSRLGRPLHGGAGGAAKGSTADTAAGPLAAGLRRLTLREGSGGASPLAAAAAVAAAAPTGGNSAAAGVPGLGPLGAAALGPLGASLAARASNAPAARNSAAAVVPAAFSTPAAEHQALPATPFYTPYSPGRAAAAEGSGLQPAPLPPSAAELAAAAAAGLTRVAGVKRALDTSLARAGSSGEVHEPVASLVSSAAAGAGAGGQQQAAGLSAGQPQGVDLKAFGSNLEVGPASCGSPGSPSSAAAAAGGAQRLQGGSGEAEPSVLQQQHPASEQQQQQQGQQQQRREPEELAEAGDSEPAPPPPPRWQPQPELLQQPGQQQWQQQHGEEAPGRIGDEGEGTAGGEAGSEAGTAQSVAGSFSGSPRPQSTPVGYHGLPPSATTPDGCSVAGSPVPWGGGQGGGGEAGRAAGEGDGEPEEDGGASEAGSFHTAYSSARPSTATPSCADLSSLGTLPPPVVAAAAAAAAGSASTSGAGTPETGLLGQGQGSSQGEAGPGVAVEAPAEAGALQLAQEQQQQQEEAGDAAGESPATAAATAAAAAVGAPAQQPRPEAAGEPDGSAAAARAGPELAAAAVAETGAAEAKAAAAEGGDGEAGGGGIPAGTGSPAKSLSLARVEVQVSTNYASPQAGPAALSSSSTPARADILSATPMHARQGSFASAASGGGSPTAYGRGRRAPQQVVRVTAANLDLSRPLESLDLLSVYHASVVPQPGQVFEFQPDPGLQSIAFERPDLLEALKDLGLRPTAATLPDIDAAQNLGGWAVAALCRSMSLDNILTYLTAALLERQMVVFCPNIGVLCGVVLALVPMLLPFCWQSLLLPVLPASQSRLEIMEAPVPFVLGVMYKTHEVRSRCGGLVRVNVYKDKVKNTPGLPQLPSHQALHDALLGTYTELRKIGQQRAAVTRPVYMVSDAQQVLAECFLSTLQKYLKGLMADLKAYTITDVSAENDRVSVLLRDSFVDSFPPRDRPFMRQFAETQMFAVYCDAVLDGAAAGPR